MFLGPPTVQSHDLAVVHYAQGAHVVAPREFLAGEPLLQVEGVLTTVPRRYSLQVSATEHVDVPGGLTAEAQREGFLWSFLDHACEPNAMFRGPQLVALRSIRKGEAISFHYATTEWDMAEPFLCHCGSTCCAGQIRGFRWLTDKERQRLRPWLAAHLLARFEAR